MVAHWNHHRRKRELPQMTRMLLQKKVLLALWVQAKKLLESKSKNLLQKIKEWVSKEDKNKMPKKKLKKILKQVKILSTKNIFRSQLMRLMLKLKTNLVHLNSLAQDLQLREWKLLKKKLPKRIKRTLKQHTKKCMVKIMTRMNLRSFLQSQRWVKLAACKLNSHKRSSLVARHQRVL